MSTIHIGFAKNNFRTIEKRRYCSNDYYGYDDYGHVLSLLWFQQHDICLRIHQGIDLVNCYKWRCDLKTVCKPHEKYLFPYNDAHSLTHNKNSLIAKFLSLFKAKLIYKETAFEEQLGPWSKGFIPMFYSNVSNANSFTGLFLSVSARYLTNGLWAHEGTIQVLNSTQPFNNPAATFVLCTKDSLPPDKPTCNSTYFQCNDGTCLDEHLVCDGRQHCMMGEDENKCTRICTDKVQLCFKLFIHDQLSLFKRFLPVWEVEVVFLLGNSVTEFTIVKMVQMNQCHVNLTLHKYKGVT